MKKIVIIFFAAILLFGANSDDINQKLNLILQKMSELEKKVDKKDQEIEKLKHELNSQKVIIKKQKEETKKEFIINSCQNLKVKNFNFKYDGAIIPNYFISYDLINKYPYTIKEVTGRLNVKDKDNVVMLSDFMSKGAAIKPNGKLHIEKVHTIVGQLEKTLNEETPATVTTTFVPTKIVFANGRVAKCGGFIGVNF